MPRPRRVAKSWPFRGPRKKPRLLRSFEVTTCIAYLPTTWLSTHRMILCVGATPAVQRVMVFRHLVLDAVNRAVQTVDGTAGKSINVAKVLKALGEEPLATGFLGGDRGEYLRSALEARAIEHAFVQVPPRTRQCVTVIDEANNRQTELVEESQPVPEAAYEQLERIVRERIQRCRAIVLSGTLTPGGPVDFYLRCNEMANRAGLLAIVDAQGDPLRLALNAGPGLVKPNRAELEATLGRKLPNERSVRAGMRELSERGARRVVVTAGSEASFAFDGKTFWKIQSPGIRAINPIGSGDAFTAGLAARLVRGDDLGEACRWGSAAGTANALTILAGEVEEQDMARLLNQVMVEIVKD